MTTPSAPHKSHKSLSHYVVRCPDGRERHYSSSVAMREETYAMDIPDSVVLHLAHNGGSVIHEASGTIVTVVYK